jgi:hypothetical protein
MTCDVSGVSWVFQCIFGSFPKDTKDKNEKENDRFLHIRATRVDNNVGRAGVCVQMGELNTEEGVVVYNGGAPSLRRIG